MSEPSSSACCLRPPPTGLTHQHTASTPCSSARWIPHGQTGEGS